MTSTSSSIEYLVTRARDGSSAALGELLERHRGYLKVLAERVLDGRVLDGRVKARLDASDIAELDRLAAEKAREK